MFVAGQALYTGRQWKCHKATACSCPVPDRHICQASNCRHDSVSSLFVTVSCLWLFSASSSCTVWSAIYCLIIILHSFISGMHHYKCIAPSVDISLESGWFWAKLITSFRERLNDSRFCWIVFIHMVRGRPGGLLQFSSGGWGGTVKIFFASASVHLDFRITLNIC